MHRLLIRLAVLVLCLGGTLVMAQTSSPVDLSVHNLSALGPSTRPYISTDNNTAVCIFCHAPHNTNGVKPLWNKELPTSNPAMYTSSTYVQQNNTISERSKECLSCHDGTIALGQTVATGDLGVPSKMSGSSVLAGDLLRDHPVSFTMPAKDDGELASWLLAAPMVSPDAAVNLYDNKVECRTCHDPHTPDIDGLAKNFLVRSNQNGDLCKNCHDVNRGVMANWLDSGHANAQNQPVSTSLHYPTVAQNACTSCHVPHNAAGNGPRLLRGVDDMSCANCHSGVSNSWVTPAPVDVLTGVRNAGNYSHPIEKITGVHDPAEKLPASQRHSDCADCHNPHATKAQTTSPVPPAVQSTLRGVSGLSADGTTTLPQANNQYEVCFKCHAGSSNKPQNANYLDYGRTPLRQTQLGLALNDQYNNANEFLSLTVQSSHNVVRSRSTYASPSLRTAMLDVNGNPGTRDPRIGYIYCTDCHSSDFGKSDGGTNASGPHASKWPHMLERRYDFNNLPATLGGATNDLPFTTGPQGTYALCDKCHDVNGYLVNGPDAVFGYHQRHVQKGGISCESCHAPHGIQGSDATHHGGLIDLDTAMATNPDGTPITATWATGAGINTQNRTCNIICHGHKHNRTYPK